MGSKPVLFPRTIASQKSGFPCVDSSSCARQVTQNWVAPACCMGGTRSDFDIDDVGFEDGRWLRGEPYSFATLGTVLFTTRHDSTVCMPPQRYTDPTFCTWSGPSPSHRPCICICMSSVDSKHPYSLIFTKPPIIKNDMLPLPNDRRNTFQGPVDLSL
jgi:hypothetical protein